MVLKLGFGFRLMLSDLTGGCGAFAFEDESLGCGGTSEVRRFFAAGGALNGNMGYGLPLQS